MPKTVDFLLYLYQSAKAVERHEITPEQHVEDTCYTFAGFRPRIPKPKSKLVRSAISPEARAILSQIRHLADIEE